MKSDASSISPISKQGSGNLGVKALAPALFKNGGRAEQRSPEHDSPGHLHQTAAEADASSNFPGDGAQQAPSSLAPLASQQKQLRHLRIHGAEQNQGVNQQQPPVQLQDWSDDPRADAEASSSSVSSNSVDERKDDMPEESDIGTSAGPSHQLTAGAVASGTSKDMHSTARPHTAASPQATGPQVCTGCSGIQTSTQKLVIDRMKLTVISLGAACLSVAFDAGLPGPTADHHQSKECTRLPKTHSIWPHPAELKDRTDQGLHPNGKITPFDSCILGRRGSHTPGRCAAIASIIIHRPDPRWVAQALQ